MSQLTLHQTLQTYYLALFGRAADPEGLDFWFSEVDSGRLDLPGVLAGMLQSEEFQARQIDLAELEDNGWVNVVYQDLFARDAEDAGIEYWSAVAKAGLSPQELLQAIFNGAAPTDAEAMHARAAIADFYSRHTDAYDADQPLVQDGFRSNEQLYAELGELDARHDALQVEQIGESLEGRPIFRADVGEGPRKLMIVTQQHGDEPTGTEAAMYLLEWLSGDSEAAQALRQEVSVSVIPRVNPDGFARWEQLVAGELDPDDIVAPRRNSADIDLNRTWEPDDQELILADIPEAVAVRNVLEAFQPDLVLDYHNQNNYTNDADLLETFSVLWATHDEVDPALTAVAQQAAVALYQNDDSYDFGTLSLYPGGDTPQIARNGLGLDGYPALLIEQRGLEEMQLAANEGLGIDYTALFSALTLEGLLSMLTIIEAMAEDGFESIDPELAMLIPERGERTPYEEIYAEEFAMAARGDTLDLGGMATGHDELAALVGTQEPVWADVAA